MKNIKFLTLGALACLALVLTGCPNPNGDDTTKGDDTKNEETNNGGTNTTGLVLKIKDNKAAEVGCGESLDFEILYNGETPDASKLYWYFIDSDGTAEMADRNPNFSAKTSGTRVADDTTLVIDHHESRSTLKVEARYEPTFGEKYTATKDITVKVSRDFYDTTFKLLSLGRFDDLRVETADVSDWTFSFDGTDLVGKKEGATDISYTNFTLGEIKIPQKTKAFTYMYLDGKKVGLAYYSYYPQGYTTAPAPFDTTACYRTTLYFGKENVQLGQGVVQTSINVTDVEDTIKAILYGSFKIFE